MFLPSVVCHGLRHLWLKSVTPIYNRITPRSIHCEHAARRFLVDQEGPCLGSPMSAIEVVRMVRNAGVVEQAILQFEREIVSRVRSMLDARIRIVSYGWLTFNCNSEWPVSRRVQWIRYAQASSDLDSHRADTVHSFLLLTLESDEA